MRRSYTAVVKHFVRILVHRYQILYLNIIVHIDLEKLPMILVNYSQITDPSLFEEYMVF